MPQIEPEHFNVDELPGVWTPVQWDMTIEERVQEDEQQAQASLLKTVDVPEAILRLLTGEYEVERIFAPPAGYNPEQQGDWDESLITFAFKRAARLVEVTREAGRLVVTYNLAGWGYWQVTLTPDDVRIIRV
jgi:hypothetical protein